MKNKDFGSFVITPEGIRLLDKALIEELEGAARGQARADRVEFEMNPQFVNQAEGVTDRAVREQANFSLTQTYRDLEEARGQVLDLESFLSLNPESTTKVLEALKAACTDLAKRYKGQFRFELSTFEAELSELFQKKVDFDKASEEMEVFYTRLRKLTQKMLALQPH